MEKTLYSMERQLIHLQYPIWDGDTHVHTLEVYSLLAAPLRDALHQIRDHYTGYTSQDFLLFFDFTPIIDLGLDQIKVDELTVCIGRDERLPLNVVYDEVRQAMFNCGFEEIDQVFHLIL